MAEIVRTKGLDIEDIMDSAYEASRIFRRQDQETTDRIVEAVYKAAFNSRINLAKMAHKETRLGKWEDKAIKNVIATRFVYLDIKNLKTVGVINEDKEHEVVEVAEPLGPIFAVTPITNPTSTVLFKILIALKSRNPIIIRPHGAAKKCSIAAAKICYEAAIKAGAPQNCVQWIKRSTEAETIEFMSHRRTALVLATGSVSLVRAAYSSGNPAIGIGPGNVPVYIGKSADVEFAVDQIFLSKTFDNGTICASEQAIIAKKINAEKVKEAFRKKKAYFLSPDEIKKLEVKAFNTETKVMRPEVIGQSAVKIAEMAGIDVPDDTTLLIAELDGVGIEYPLSLEILAPILAFYTADEFEVAIELCRQINKHGGLGHTVSIFSNNEERIEYFSSVMNAGRVLVNTPASQGALGGTYNALQPSMMLACGSGGKNLTTDNISARHLLNIHRIARRKLHACAKHADIADYLNEELDADEIEMRCRSSHHK